MALALGIRIFEHTAQTLYQHHSLGYFVGGFGQCINLIHRRSSKLDSTLLTERAGIILKKNQSVLREKRVLSPCRVKISVLLPI